MKLNRLAIEVSKLASKHPEFEVEDIRISDGRQYVCFSGKNAKGNEKELEFDWEEDIEDE